MPFHFLTRSRWKRSVSHSNAVPNASQACEGVTDLFRSRPSSLSLSELQTPPSISPSISASKWSLLVTHTVESVRFHHPEQSLIVESTLLYFLCHQKVQDHWLPHFQQSRYQMKNQLVEGGLLFQPLLKLSNPVSSHS